VVDDPEHLARMKEYVVMIVIVVPESLSWRSIDLPDFDIFVLEEQMMGDGANLDSIGCGRLSGIHFGILPMKP
jgi:hypothetical protein